MRRDPRRIVAARQQRRRLQLVRGKHGSVSIDLQPASRRPGRHGDRRTDLRRLSYVEPDVHSSGKVLTSRIRGQSDIWRFPVGGSPDENTHNAVRVTRQSGQVQTPSVSPDGTEVVYLSDNGGHGNLWVTKTDGSGVARQITFERDRRRRSACRSGRPSITASPSSSAAIASRSGGQFRRPQPP